jgi:hypothetical protein
MLAAESQYYPPYPAVVVVVVGYAVMPEHVTSGYGHVTPDFCAHRYVRCSHVTFGDCHVIPH